MLFVFYNCIISFILLSIFAIGAISFSDNLLDWVDKHWEEIRSSAHNYSMSDFKNHVSQELVSLGAFALTIDMSLFIMFSTILLIQGLEKVMLALFPLTNLLFIVFSSAICFIALYFNEHTYYTSALPGPWANYTLFFTGIFVGGVGLVGYWSGTRGRFTYLMIYILVLSLSSFMCLITGLAMILKTSSIKDIVSREWPEISQRLKEAGYEVAESTFSNFLEVNLKFGGLFVIIFCLFLILGLLPAIYLSIVMKRRTPGGHTVVQGVGLGGSTPYRMNSDQTSPKLRG